MQKDPKLYRIILLEDNPGDALLVQDYLEETIIEPQLSLYTSFEEAKPKLIQNAYDLILLDLTLPDNHGLDLINDILSLARNAPVVVLTGYADLNFSIKSLSYGIADYLIKEDLNATTMYKSIVYNIERNKILVNLKESEKRNSMLFHLSPLPMWVFDTKSLKIIDVNDAAIEHYGYSLEEFKALTIGDLRPASELDRLHATLLDNQENDSFKSRGTWIHRKKNGELIQVDIRSKYVVYEDREARIIVANDISERLNQIQKLELQNRTFKEISWLQSHVVRAPLARMLGLVDVLLDEEISNEDRITCLNHLKTSGQELDKVIFDIVKKAYEVNKDFE